MSTVPSSGKQHNLDDVVLSKNARFSWHDPNGGSGLSILVIDNALENPDLVREIAWNSRFHLPSVTEYYPGWLTHAQMSGEKRLIQELATLFLDRLWPSGWPSPLSVADLLPSSKFSVFGLDQSVAARNGYIDQHVDGNAWIAVVTYLFEHEESADVDRGTAFWMHRPTGLQTLFPGDLQQAAMLEHLCGLQFIDSFRKASTLLPASSMQEACKQIIEHPRSNRKLFSLEEDETWKLKTFVPARFNRMIAYPTWQFHSIVDTSAITELSTHNARLTYNTFIPYPMPASFGPQHKYRGGGYIPIDGMHV